LYCAGDSSSSRSVEHVVPQSLGNTTVVLPATVVCDACNNYFARKVEGPVLGSDAFLSLRNLEGVANKRGRIPFLTVPTSAGVEGELYRYTEGPLSGLLSLPAPVAHAVARGMPLEIAVPDRDAVVIGDLFSRFIAKVALGVLAWRCLGDPQALTALPVDEILDPCRRWARFGAGRPWPVRVNRIHPSDHAWQDGEETAQRVWEADFLGTPAGDLYFAVALYGLECAINALEPEIDGYERWLAATGAPSLLYPAGLPPSQASS
jgi:hypothetical protein